MLISMQDGALVELRKIRKGGVFALRGSEDRYLRGPYRHACGNESATFLCQHPASMTHHHFAADCLVRNLAPHRRPMNPPTTLTAALTLLAQHNAWRRK